MPRRRKPKPKPDIHVLCAAVRSLRAKLRLSQQELAAKLKIAVMTLSRFERGVQVPRDPGVLVKLRDAARSSTILGEEFRTFECAVVDAANRTSRENAESLPVWSPEQWELMQCARIAITLFPEEAKAMRKAAGESMRLVKEVIRQGDALRAVDYNFYAALEKIIDELMHQEAFERLQKGGDQ